MVADLTYREAAAIDGSGAGGDVATGPSRGRPTQFCGRLGTIGARAGAYLGVWVCATQVRLLAFGM